MGDRAFVSECAIKRNYSTPEGPNHTNISKPSEVYGNSLDQIGLSQDQSHDWNGGV
jgi:hypothetical protein